MIITDQLVFAHVPKTGGVFLQETIAACFPVIDRWDGDESHRSIEFLPALHHGKPVLTVLRNPWAWYLSWFTFCQAEGDNEEFLRNHVPGPRAFADTVKGLLAPNHSDAAINDLMRQTNIGLFEMHRFHVLDAGRSDHDVTYGRLEHLAGDFMTFLDKHGIRAPRKLAKRLRARPTNTSRHADWQDAYEPALFDLVAVKERRIIALGGYVRDEHPGARLPSS